MSEGTMRLRLVGQVSPGAKHQDHHQPLRNRTGLGNGGGIATFYVNLDHLKQGLEQKEQVTAISQLAHK
jgi:uncharacterized cupin superfamily protein